MSYEIIVQVGILWMIAITLSHQLAECRSSPHKKLLTELLKNYGPISERPVFNNSDVIHVQFRIIVDQLLDFQEQVQKIRLFVSMTQLWQDELLRWNPHDHEGVNRLFIDVERIWQPDITLYSGLDPKFMRIGKTTAIVTSEGEIKWETPVILENFCHVRVKYFPFDDQYCKLRFVSWIFSTSELRLEEFLDNDTQKDWYNYNAVWQLVKVDLKHTNQTYCCPLVYDELEYILQFKRQSTFYILSIVVPTAMLSPLTLLVFYLPPESGDKIGLAINNILALLLFLNLVFDTMPPIGDEFPLIGTHIFIMVIISCVSLIIEVIVLRMYHFGRGGVPEEIRHLRSAYLLKKFVRSAKKKHQKLQARRRSKQESRHNDPKVHTTSFADILTSEIERDVLSAMRSDPTTDESEDHHNDDEEIESNISWGDRRRMKEFVAAFMVERVAFIVLLLSMVTSMLYVTFAFVFRHQD